MKLNRLREDSGSSRPLKQRISDIESTFKEELGSKTLEIKDKDRRLRQSLNEVKRLKLRLADSEKKMSLREDEISLLEEKILGLQKNIRWD